MAVKTKTQILAEIASLFADNTTGDISASDLRTVTTDIVDSYGESLVATGTLTAAQINALDTTPIELIPAQGANKIIVVTGATCVRKAGTAYVTAADIRINYATTSSSLLTIMDSGGLTGTANYIYVNYSANDSYTNTDVNDAVQFTCTGAISGGTGDMYYEIDYKVIDFN